jgi:hypothetical protein
MGKLCLRQTNTRKANTQWEWRDGESSVYPLWQEAGWWCICALGWRELGLVLRNPVVIGDPQLGINRFGSPLLLRHEDLVTSLHVEFQ